MKEKYTSSMPLLHGFIIILTPIVLVFTFFYDFNNREPDIAFISIITAVLSIILLVLISLIPSKLECDEKQLIMHDLFRGKRKIPLQSIRSIQVTINTYTSKNICQNKYYICEMYIFTSYKKYTYKMNVKNKIAEYISDTNTQGFFQNKVTFIKLKQYIESRVNIKKNGNILLPVDSD